MELRRRHGSRVPLGAGEAPGPRTPRRLNGNAPESSLREPRRDRPFTTLAVRETLAHLNALVARDEIRMKDRDGVHESAPA